jgi:membrane protease YdiL (CAAX protease family)
MNMRHTPLAVLHALVRPRIRLKVDHSLNPKLVGKTYLISLVVFAIGTTLPALLITFAPLVVLKFDPNAALVLINLLVDSKGQIRVEANIMLSIICFLTGFGAQVAYTSRALSKRGVSLARYLNLGCASLQGRSRTSKFIFLAGQIAFYAVLWCVIERLLYQFISHGTQPTTELAKSAAGASLVAFFVLAVVLAPLFEEIIFRGFLFQSLRSTFRGGRDTESRAINHRSDIMAMAVSSGMFALLHFQFDPGIMLMLFLMGCYACEIYRRSGSLLVVMAFHAINNAAALSLVIFFS